MVGMPAQPHTPSSVCADVIVIAVAVVVNRGEKRCCHCCSRPSEVGMREHAGKPTHTSTHSIQLNTNTCICFASTYTHIHIHTNKHTNTHTVVNIIINDRRSLARPSEHNLPLLFPQWSTQRPQPCCQPHSLLQLPLHQRLLWQSCLHQEDACSPQHQ